MPERTRLPVRPTGPALLIVALLIAALLIVALFAVPVPTAAAGPGAARPALDPPTGPDPVGRADLELVDPHRPDPWVGTEPRRLMVTVWYPARDTAGRAPAPYLGPALAAQADATANPALGLAPGAVDWARVDTHAVLDPPAARDRLPVVLYSPGAFESRLWGTGLAVDLASHGYAVVTVDHTYETAVEFPSGLVGPRVGTDRLREMSAARLADNRFVLDELADRVDLTRVATVGHSLGGDVAVQTLADDPRVDVAVDLDGFLAYDDQGRDPIPAARSGVDRPVLLMGSASMPVGGEWRLRSHETNPAWAALWEHSTGGREDVGVPEGRHHVFTDHRAVLPQLPADRAAVARLIGDLSDPAATGRAIHERVRAFLDETLVEEAR